MWDLTVLQGGMFPEGAAAGPRDRATLTGRNSGPFRWGGSWEPAGVPHSTLLPRGPRSHVGGVGRCTGSRLLANPRCMLTTPRARTGSPVLAEPLKWACCRQHAVNCMLQVKKHVWLLGRGHTGWHVAELRLEPGSRTSSLQSYTTSQAPGGEGHPILLLTRRNRGDAGSWFANPASVP